jgi:hypothetical protein
MAAPPPRSALANAVGDRWWECCWRIRLPRWILPFGEYVTMQFNPVLFQHLVDTLITLNIMISSPLRAPIHDVLASIHRLLVVPMVLVVGLYCVFRQRRPAVVIATKRPLGTAYGMPSGDSLFSAMVAVLSFAKKPVFATLLFSRSARRGSSAGTTRCRRSSSDGDSAH